MAEVQQAPNKGEMAHQFVQFVMVQAQNILFVLGKIPTPEGTLMSPNLQAAKMLIDQLEMIQFKTQGNLSEQEQKILKDALTNVQLAFVEVSGGTPASMMPSTSPDVEETLKEMSEEKPAPSEETPKASEKTEPAEEKPAEDRSEDDEKRKFFKSYG